VSGADNSGAYALTDQNGAVFPISAVQAVSALPAG
jgi:hypothetical protein